MKDIVIYLNGGTVFRVWAKSEKDGLKVFEQKFGPWSSRPGYHVYAKEFRL